MYDHQCKDIDLNDLVLKMLTLLKNNDYYVNKYQQNLLISRVLKNDKTIINECCSLISLRNNDQIVQIEKYKKLKDEGVITQEEFDAKKKQILGL